MDLLVTNGVVILPLPPQKIHYEKNPSRHYTTPPRLPTA